MLLKLPEHLLIDVLKSLSKKDLLRAGATCQYMRRVSFDPILWKGFGLKMRQRKHRSEKEAVAVWVLFLNNLPFQTLEFIEWINCNETFADLKVIVDEHHLTLRRLELIGEDITDEQLDVLCMSAPYVNNLTVSGGASVTDAALTSILKLRSLAHIDLSYCNRITEEGFIWFVESVTSDLISVNTDNVNYLGDRAISTLANRFSHSLVNLNFDGEENTDAVFTSIRECRRLESLIVNFCESLTDVALDRLGCLRRLREVTLRKGSEFLESGLRTFLSNESFVLLQRLNLSECGNLSTLCAVTLAGSCPNLKYLALAWCYEVCELGANAIVTSCHQMEEMDLTGLHMLTGASFLLIPDQMPQLKFLKLDMCNNVNDEIIHAIVREMKGQLSVENYYAETVVYELTNSDDESNSSNV